MWEGKDGATGPGTTFFVLLGSDDSLLVSKVLG